MTSNLAKRLLAGESLPVEQMLEAAESLVDLCREQKEEIESLEADNKYLRRFIESSLQGVLDNIRSLNRPHRTEPANGSGE